MDGLRDLHLVEYCVRGCVCVCMRSYVCVCVFLCICACELLETDLWLMRPGLFVLCVIAVLLNVLPVVLFVVFILLCIYQCLFFSWVLVTRTLAICSTCAVS